MNGIKENENHSYDIGYVSYNNSKNIAMKKVSYSKKKYIWKPLVGIIFGVIVLLFHPTNDIYYYIASMINFMFIGWSFVDLIEEHNLLSTNKLPQFEKRGGEEK